MLNKAAIASMADSAMAGHSVSGEPQPPPWSEVWTHFFHKFCIVTSFSLQEELGADP